MSVLLVLIQVQRSTLAICCTPEGIAAAVGKGHISRSSLCGFVAGCFLHIIASLESGIAPFHRDRQPLAMSLLISIPEMLQAWSISLPQAFSDPGHRKADKRDTSV